MTLIIFRVQNQLLLAFLILLTIYSCKNESEKALARKENIRKGKELFGSMGCMTCHSLKGDKMYGPPLNNILGKNIRVLREKKPYTITIDEEYIKQSIRNPDYEKPDSFSTKKMPKPVITEEEISNLSAFIIHINSDTLSKY
ncbi:MAG: cytochrome c [Bacteroidales bacterium]|nr:cytochrome c [Bacteroidales bacterium]